MKTPTWHRNTIYTSSTPVFTNFKPLDYKAYNLSAPLTFSLLCPSVTKSYFFSFKMAFNLSFHCHYNPHNFLLDFQPYLQLRKGEEE